MTIKCINATNITLPMKITTFIIIIVATLLSCNHSTYALKDYIQNKETFKGKSFVSAAGGFSIMLPSDWQTNEETDINDSITYYLEALPISSEEIGLQAFTVFHGAIINGNANTYFDSALEKSKLNSSNIKIVEKTTLKINNLDAQVAYLVYTKNNEIIQKEIDIFIPYGNQQYYWIGVVCDNNAYADKTLIKLLDCVETFKVK